jgi:hypothetical protein
MFYKFWHRLTACTMTISLKSHTALDRSDDGYWKPCVLDSSSEGTAQRMIDQKRNLTRTRDTLRKPSSWRDHALPCPVVYTPVAVQIALLYSWFYLDMTTLRLQITFRRTLCCSKCPCLSHPPDHSTSAKRFFSEHPKLCVFELRYLFLRRTLIQAHHGT